MNLIYPQNKVIDNRRCFLYECVMTEADVCLERFQSNLHFSLKLSETNDSPVKPALVK